MSSLPSRFRDNLGEVRVNPDQDLGYLPKLLTGSIRPSHEQSCSRRSKAGPGADVAIAAALAGKPRLSSWQPNAICSFVDFGRRDRFKMAASEIGTVDQDPSMLDFRISPV